MWGCWDCLWGFSVWKSLGAEVMRETEAYLFMHLDVQAIGHLIILQGGEEGMSGTKGSFHTSQHSLCPPIHGVFSCSSRPLPQNPKTPQPSLQGSTGPTGVRRALAMEGLRDAYPDSLREGTGDGSPVASGRLAGCG